jgi:hypothetical protein
MEIIPLYEKRRKHKRRKKWRERKSPKETGELTGKRLWFRGWVSCRVCGLKISEADLERRGLYWCSVTDDNGVKYIYLYENGWERIDKKPCGLRGTGETLKRQYYLCAECKGLESLSQK